jgi:hypothetical protein
MSQKRDMGHPSVSFEHMNRDAFGRCINGDMSKPLLPVSSCLVSLLMAQPMCAQSGPTVVYNRATKPLPGQGPVLSQADQTAAWNAYKASLGKMCPRQRVELQTPTQMNLQVQSFMNLISPEQTESYHHYAGQLCEVSKPSAACANTALLAAADKGKFLERFTAFECDKGIRCTAEGKCAVPR